MEIRGLRMLLGLLIGIVLLIFLMMKTKIQAFLALILRAITVGVIGGMPLVATDIVDAAGEFKSGVSIVNSITGGFGSTLGRIITDSGFGGYIANGLAGTTIPIALLPLVISTLMRFVQGSGTVAMTTAASITAPILIASGTVSPMLGAVACCVGSLFFSYFL